MPAEKGIFLDVLPRFDMAAMGAILNEVTNLFKKSGAAMGASFGAEAEARIAALAEAERKSANVTEDAELRKTRAIHQTEVAEQQASVATDKRVLAQKRLTEMQDAGTASENALAAAKIRVEAATVAETRAAYAASDAALAATARQRDLAAATALSSAAHDKHAEAVAASTVATSNMGKAFNVAGLAATGTFVVGLAEATKQASNFEVAQTRIQVATGETAKQIKTLHDGILTLGPQIGQTAQDLENASFILAKGNFKDASDQLAILKAGGQLARVELAPLDETMKGITTTLTDFGLKGADAPKVVSQLQVALGNAKVPMNEFMGSLHNVEPVFKMLTGGDPAKAAAGIAQVTTALARMTQNGTSADQASQNIRNSILQLSTIGDNQKAATTLGQLGLNASTLQQELTDPAIGYLGVLDKIHNAIETKLGPDGKLLESALYSNPQAAQDMVTQYNALDDAHRKMADAIQNGTIPSLKDLHLTEAEGQQGDLLKQWDKARQVVEGFNPILAKHGDLMRNALQLWKDSTGSTQGLIVASQLYGNDEAAAGTNDLQKQVQGAAPDASGNIEGWNKVTDTLRFKLDAAKASLGALAIQVGEVFLPAMKAVADVLSTVFEWFNKNAGVAETLMGIIGTFSGVWLAFKAAAIGGAMWTTVTEGLGTMIVGFGKLKTAIGLAATEFQVLGGAATTAQAEVVAASEAEVIAEGEVGTAALTTATDVGAVGAAALSAAGALGAMYLAVQQVNSISPDANKHESDFGSFWDEAKSWMSDGYSGTTKPGTGSLTLNPDLDGKGQGAANPERNIGLGPNRGRALPPVPPAGLNLDQTPPGGPAPGMPDYGGLMPGGLGIPEGGAGGAASKVTGAAPVGSRNDPVFIDPSSITDGLNASDMGADGSVGSGITDIFTNAGSGGFTLPNIAKLMGTFVANLALGNPAGKLATGQFGDGGGLGGEDLTQSITTIENMTPAERIEAENTIKMQKGIRAYQKALRAYAKAVSKYGPNSDQALDAEDSVLNARDSLSSIEINGQQAGGAAAQKFADDQVNGMATKNPGQYAKDQAAAAAYGGGGGGGGGSFTPGKGAEGWRGTVADTVAKYGAAAGIPASQFGNWTDAIVRQIDTESKGNPGADNPNDSNGRGGTQHVAGLLQYLPSTFANSAEKLTGITNMMDPTAQIAGALLAKKSATGAPVDIGNGIGWGPSRQPVDTSLVQNTPVQAPVAPSAPAAPAQSPLQSLLSQFTGGGGLGPTFKQSPAPNTSNGGAPGPFDNSPAAVKARENADPQFQHDVGHDVDIHGRPLAAGSPPAPSPAGISPLGDLLGGRGLPQAPAPKAPAPAAPGVKAPGANAVNGQTPGGIGQTATAGVKTSQPAGGSGKGGVGASSGLMGAAMAATSALDVIAPGAGEAAKIGIQEANRAAQYAGQVAGIGMQGLLETFTLHGEDGAGGKGGWLGKIAGGLAGAHPTTPNAAGAAKDTPKPAPPAPPLQPGQGQTNGQPNGDQQGSNNGNINIAHQEINHGDGGAQNRDALRQLTAYNM